MLILDAGKIVEVDPKAHARQSKYMFLRASGNGVLQVTQESHETASYLSCRIPVNETALVSLPIMRQANLTTVMSLTQGLIVDSLLAHTPLESFVIAHFVKDNYAGVNSNAITVVQRGNHTIKSQARPTGYFAYTKKNKVPTALELRGAAHFSYGNIACEFNGVVHLVIQSEVSILFTKYSNLTMVALDALPKSTPQTQVINLGEQLRKVTL